MHLISLKTSFVKQRFVIMIHRVLSFWTYEIKHQMWIKGQRIYSISHGEHACVSVAVAFKNGLRWRCLHRPLLPLAHPPPPPLHHPPFLDSWSVQIKCVEWIWARQYDFSHCCFSFSHLLFLQQVSLVLIVVHFRALALFLPAGVLGRHLLWFSALHICADTQK